MKVRRQTRILTHRRLVATTVAWVWNPYPGFFWHISKGVLVRMYPRKGARHPTNKERRNATRNLHA